MKLKDELLKFPNDLPNDFEKLIIFYPSKFPGIIDYYEGVAQKIAGNPKAYQEYGDWARDQLRAGFNKLEKDYEEHNSKDLAFLVDMDQRLHKLFCYRFWIVNYLFADGPLHDYFVTNLKVYIHKFIDVGENAEDFESRILQVQRDLLQSDYADLYLRQALDGVNFMKLLNEDSRVKALVEEAIPFIDKHSQDYSEKVYSIWEKLLNILNQENGDVISKLKEKLYHPLEQAKMRNTMMPVYNMLTHTVEFRYENEQLYLRHDQMKKRIGEIMAQAKDKLSTEDYEMFELSYLQARNFSKYKDVIGDIDGDLLPFWFRKVIGRIKELLDLPLTNDTRANGHAAMFKYIVWHLPNDLKAKVMSVDTVPFDLNTL